MKILLTGGAGFIGSHTAVELVNNGYEPVIIDDFRNSKPFILKNIETVTGKKIISYAEDLGNTAKLREIIEIEKPLGIIHFAADKAVNESVLNPIKYYKNNVVNLIKLVEIIDEYNIKSFVFSSSCKN
jgi:UDP-glucose 4-epimerase